MGAYVIPHKDDGEANVCVCACVCMNWDQTTIDFTLPMMSPCYIYTPMHAPTHTHKHTQTEPCIKHGGVVVGVWGAPV